MIGWLLGRLMQPLINAVTPRRLLRGAEEQQMIDEQTRRLILYQSPACPYCFKVWYAIFLLNLNIETRDISRNARWRSELKGEGGRDQVPCLRIAEEGGPVLWLYESAEIIEYLSQRFSSSPEDRTQR